MSFNFPEMFTFRFLASCSSSERSLFEQFCERLELRFSLLDSIECENLCRTNPNNRKQTSQSSRTTFFGNVQIFKCPLSSKSHQSFNSSQKEEKSNRSEAPHESSRSKLCEIKHLRNIERHY